MTVSLFEGVVIFVASLAAVSVSSSSLSLSSLLTSNRLLLKGQQNQRATRPKIKEKKQINKKKIKQNKKTNEKEIFKKYEIKIRPIKINKFNLRWRKVQLGLPSFFLSHSSFSILFETLSSPLCSCISYQQLEALQVLSNAFVGRREIAFCVGAMPAKDKRKRKNKERQEEHVVGILVVDSICFINYIMLSYSLSGQITMKRYID